MPIQYDLQPVHLPRLAGAPLKLFVQALESPLSRGPLIQNLLRTGGIEAFRQRSLTEPPTLMPFWPQGQPNAPGPAPDLDALARSVRPSKGFAFATVADYLQAYQSGKITPLEVADWLLDAVAASNANQPALRAIIACREADVRAQAKSSTQRWQAGQPLSVMDGVPVAIKDEFDLAGYPTQVGTSFMGQSPARTDAFAVGRLRAAGALLFGKANMHEIGIGVTGHNPHHGVARNPYQMEHYTGGSSSGPAAAVASGLCPVALGADGGGSIRIPASFCGVVGLKPTFGRVSERGAAPLGWSVAHIGPLAATARDAALAYSLIAGPDPAYPNSQRQPLLSLERFEDLDLWGLRIGVYWPWFKDASPQVVTACQDLLEGFKSQGARIVEIEIPDLEAIRVGHVITIVSEMVTSLKEEYRRSRAKFSLEVRSNLALGRSFTASDYILAQCARTHAMQAFRLALEQADVIATPTTAITAPPIHPDSLPDGDSDLSTLTEIMRFAVAANFTGLPAVSMPAGYDTGGLPIGLQLMGRAWNEALLLRLAHAAEQLVERRKPVLFYQASFTI
jgi:Asp-tRNA(Asn)/Glu-tRNA(Gln) amidotransferase A subunit family amidase